MPLVPKSGFSLVIAAMFCDPCLCQNAEPSSSPPQPVEQRVVVPDQFSRYATIFVAHLETMRPVAGCTGPLPSLCPQNATLRVTQILKGGHQQQLPINLEAVLPPPGRGSFLSGWQALMQIKPNRSYLILSKEQTLQRSSLESPEAVLMLSDDEDVADDIALILGGGSLSLQDQISRVAAAISAAGKSRSFFLAQYAADLLMVGSESDTAALSNAIENARGGAFSDMAKGTLLFRLRELSQLDRPTGNRKYLWHLFVTVTARYLIAGYHPKEGEPDLDNTVQQAVWVIRTSANGDSVLRSAIEALGSAPTHQLTSDQKARVREWLQILNRR
jgi:hypothetical protein